MSEQIVIIGAGHAGTAAARELARLQKAREADITITVIDGDPALPYERPDLSKSLLLEEDFPDTAPHDWAKEGITFIGGYRVSGIAPRARNLRLSSGQILKYDTLLLATGGLPRRLPVPGFDRAHLLRHRADAERLHAALRSSRSLAVLGGGVIGLEVASTARALGLEVTVIEAGIRLMARSLPAEISAILRDRHEKSGVRFEFGHQAQEMDETGVTLDDGRRIAADLIVAGIGFLPDTTLAEAAGLELSRGIVTDADGRTSNPAIFATGDGVSFPGADGSFQSWQTWQHARRHGTHVARRICDLPSDYDPVHWFWTDQQGMNLQVAGDPLAADDVVLRGPSEGPSTRIYLREGRVTGAVMIDSGRDNRPLTALIEQGARPDRALLADTSVPLRDIAAGKHADRMATA